MPLGGDVKVSGAIHHRLTARIAVACALAASTAGCAALKTPESQLFSDRADFQSASIVYRTEHAVRPSASTDPAWKKFLNPSAVAAPGARRTTTLAVRYPHPSGRVGFARVECIVETTSSGAAAIPAMPDWLQRARQLADETLPGIALGDGIESAMALDLPIADLERVIAPLRQPVAATAASAGGAARITATLNGCALPTRGERVAELDQLVARVRREGSIVSHRGRSVEPNLMPEEAALAAKATAPGTSGVVALATASTPTIPAAEPRSADAPVVAASFAQPITRRLPPVEPQVR